MLPMGTLLLVRHGQASFGAADYDQLSELGRRQCVRLGEHLGERGFRVDATMTGTLRRHAQSLDSLLQGLGVNSEPLRWPGLNEYDSESLVRAIYPGSIPAPQTPDLARHHFRLLRQGLQAWMSGQSAPENMPSHAEFVAGVAGALTHVREAHDGNVLIVSSGGPISHAVGLVLGLAPSAIIDLNMRIRNSAVTEFQFTAKRHVLVSFNSISHLEQPALDGWVTYA